MTRARITDGHHSGKATATQAQWLRLLEQKRNAGADRFSVTEANGHEAREAIGEFCHDRGWGVVQFRGPGDGECAILHDRDVFEDLEAECLTLTDLTLKTARKAPIKAPLVKYRHLATGAVDWRTAAHLPAHLEGRKGFRHVWPTKVHRAAVKGWRTALRERGITKRTTVAGDMNLNARLAWVRVWAKAAFPSLRSAWRHPYGRRGTFKRRIIDHAYTPQLVARKARLLAAVPGVDHVGFLFDIQLDRSKE